MGNKMKIILIQSLDESVFKYKVCSFQPALIVLLGAYKIR